jgi:predicted transglutaminase-like cysteine proteinase
MKYLILFILILTSSFGISNNIQEINSDINKIKYVLDNKDEWKTPKESYSKGGDCEDFAIAKFIKLEKLYNVKMAYVELKKLNSIEPHMVLILEDSILDNLTNKILSIEDRTDLTIKYTFDRNNLYINGKTYKNNLSKWNELLNKIKG